MSGGDQQLHPETRNELVGLRASERTPVRDGDDLSKGKFNVEVMSVFYYPEEETCCAAVVLKTSFDLKDGRKLKYAMCPIAIHATSSEGGQNLHSIVGYHPEKPEYVQVAYISGTKEWAFNPHVAVQGVELELGNLKEARINDKVHVISLNATSHQDKNPHIEWMYKDDQKSRYPVSVDLLVIVKHSKPKAPWFEFGLQVMEKLKIDVHGDNFFTKLGDRFVGRSPSGNGWRFEIKGCFRGHIAEKALNSIKESESSNSIFPSIGLKAAAKEMLSALARPKEMGVPRAS